MKRLFTSFFIIILLVSHCFAKKKQKTTPAPIWITDEGRYQLFPKDDFVSGLAFGSTDEEAKNKAAAEISNQMKVKVDSVVVSTINKSEDTDGFIESSKSVLQTIKLTGENPIYQLEYTTPYFSSDLGMYICVGYINRNQAWEYIYPKLDVISKKFINAYTQAVKISDSYKRLRAIKNSMIYIDEFYQYYDFAILVNQEGAENYKKADEYALDTYLQLQKLPKECVFYINVEGDKDKRVYSAIAERLIANGYIVSSDKYNYMLNVVVTMEINDNGDIWTSYPSINIEISGNNGPVESFSKEIGKIAGYEKVSCERKAYNEISKVVSKEFLIGE